MSLLGKRERDPTTEDKSKQHDGTYRVHFASLNKREYQPLCFGGTVKCSVSTIPCPGHSYMGIPRKLPPSHSLEYLAYKKRYVLASDVHPSFFSAPRQQLQETESFDGIYDGLVWIDRDASGINSGIGTPLHVVSSNLDSRMWRWHDVARAHQIDRFNLSYGWLGKMPSKENFSILLRQTEIHIDQENISDVESDSSVEAALAPFEPQPPIKPEMSAPLVAVAS